MQARLISRLRGAIQRHRITILEAILLAAVMAVAVFVVYEYDVFANAPGIPAQNYVIELDELLALAALLCVGLLVLSWRFLILQRREMSRRVRAERAARKLAMQDTLTGLPNRRRFQRELKAAIAAPPRSNGAHALFMLDLNDFKRVNDVYGHGAGDEVLVMVAMRLQQAVRDGDLVVRMGGDEFAILARQLSGAEEATSIALRVIAALDQPMTIGPVQHQIGVGIGIALIPQDGRDSEEILRKADIALYRAKAEQDSASCFFEQEMDALVRERDLILRDLSAAIAEGAIEPFYQPLIDLRTREVVGFEAQARWMHPTLGNIPPERFIPIAETCGLIHALTDRLLREAADTAILWPNDVTLSFCIAPSQLKDQTLGLRILAILAASGLAPGRLEIGLTEAALVRDLEEAQEVLGALGEAGVRIALDDFGTGYSSLYHLRNFKFHKIKIDRSFIDEMGREPQAAVLIRTLTGLGHGLGLTVTADGIDLPDQATALLEQGCEQGQGGLYGEAMSAAETLDRIAAQGPQMAGVRQSIL